MVFLRLQVMAITKISQKCEPCEPSCEPFFNNGSHAKTLKSLSNYAHVNDVNHLHARARVEKISLLCFSVLKNTKKRIFLTREKTQKPFTSFTFFKNAYKALIINKNLCEPFLINHSHIIHIIHKI